MERMNKPLSDINDFTQTIELITKLQSVNPDMNIEECRRALVIVNRCFKIHEASFLKFAALPTCMIQDGQNLIEQYIYIQKVSREIHDYISVHGKFDVAIQARYFDLNYHARKLAIID